jgi:DNA-binding transcriptional MerR regulator/effector-binding domain-containing protein
VSMQVRIGIGDFSRMTHLSVKALRYYHDVGLLEPAHIDDSSGYRFYYPDQVPLAQVIRRFRDLGMPLEEVKAVLQAPDVAARNEVIVTHLQRMESELAQTQAVVSSLRALLERPPASVDVRYRSVPGIRALAVSETVSAADIEGWWVDAFGELYRVAGLTAAGPAGPAGTLYSGDLFEEERGEVTAFVPVAQPVAASGRTRLVEIPAVELVLAVHEGSFTDLDRTYGALGTYVAERELGIEAPIREYYLVSPFDTDDESRYRTEVGWPVFQTGQPN